jgi:TatD DNase family protein
MRGNVIPQLIDTHAHLDDERFQSDLPAVLERAKAAGVESIVAIATTTANGVNLQQ